MKSPSLFALIIVFTLVPFGPLAIDIYLPSIPQMVTAFGVEEQAIQQTIALYVFALGIFQLIAGPISDRYGRRTSAIVGLTLYATGAGLIAFAQELSWLYAGRIIQGMGASFTLVTAMAWIRDHYHGEDAGKWLSYMGGITALIPTLAPLLGGLLAIQWGWTAGFWAMFFMAATILLLASFALENKPNKNLSLNTEDKSQLACNLKNILNNSQFRTYSLANMFSFGALLTYIAIAPVVAISEGNLTEVEFAMLFGLIGISQMISSLSAPKLVTKIGQRQTVATGLSSAMLAGVLLLLLPTGSTYGFFLLAAMGASGFSLLIGSATALNLEPFSHCAGLATSLDGFIRMIGGALIVAVSSYSGLSSFHALAMALLLTIIPLVRVIRDIQHHSATETLSESTSR